MDIIVALVAPLVVMIPFLSIGILLAVFFKRILESKVKKYHNVGSYAYYITLNSILIIFIIIFSNLALFSDSSVMFSSSIIISGTAIGVCLVYLFAKFMIILSEKMNSGTVTFKSVFIACTLISGSILLFIIGINVVEVTEMHENYFSSMVALPIAIFFLAVIPVSIYCFVKSVDNKNFLPLLLTIMLGCTVTWFFMGLFSSSL